MVQIKTYRTFVSDRSGSVATTTAIVMLPLLIAVGSGIDYARAVSEKTQLQVGTDAAALAGIRAIRQGMSTAAATTVMTSVIQANDPNPAAQVANATISSDKTTLCIDSTSQIATAFMTIAGVRTIPVGAHSCSAMNIDTYEIAFAFDNSGSMANSAENGQTKIAAAKSAANALIAALTPSAGATNLTVSYAVVPFAASVNVGAANASASWMDTAAASSIHWNNYLRPAGTRYNPTVLPTSRFAMFTSMSTAWGGCVEERPAPYTISDDAATSTKPDTLYVPMLYPDEQDNNYYAYNSYLSDTGGTCSSGDAYATADNTSGRGDGQTKLCKYSARPKKTNSANGVSGGPNLACTTTAISPLNATTATTTAAISAMQPNGDTTLLAGFMWAWRTISPNGPFPGTGGTATAGPQVPKAYNYTDPTTKATNHKVIILLTDGMNHWSGQTNDASFGYFQNDPNKSIYNALGFFGDNRLGTTTASNARTLLDATTVQACANAKASSVGVEVYTVGFLATDGIDDAGVATLQSCASGADHFFKAQNGDQLVQAFQTIAATLTKPRIAR